MVEVFEPADTGPENINPFELGAAEVEAVLLTAVKTECPVSVQDVPL